jgi:hypothetical protein
LGQMHIENLVPVFVSFLIKIRLEPFVEEAIRESSPTAQQNIAGERRYFSARDSTGCKKERQVYTSCTHK